MTKKNIIIIAASAAVAIGCAVGGTLVVRNMTKGEEPSTVAATQAYEEPSYYDIPETLTAENGEVATGANGDILTTIKRVASNNKNGKNQNKNSGTTKPAAANKTTTAKKEAPSGLVESLIGDEGQQLLGYRKSSEGFYYTDDKDCWQKNAGYNEVYDNMAPAAAMYIDQIRIRFTYDEKDWMVQFWKGQYGWLFVGAEIGLYTAPKGTYTGATGDVNHYDCADQSDWLYMQLDCYFDQNHDGHYVKIFTRPYAKYWWPTGFVKGQLTKYTKPRTELKVKGRITFKSEEMANLFVTGLRQSGFGRAVGSDSLADDTYYQSGADVWVLWSTIYHDCFVGYEG